MPTMVFNDNGCQPPYPKGEIEMNAEESIEPCALCGGISLDQLGGAAAVREFYDRGGENS